MTLTSIGRRPKLHVSQPELNRSPTVLSEALQDADDERAERVMKAMLHRKKLDIQVLKDVYEQG